MSVVAVAFCPHPPLLVPEVAAGAAPELDDLRVACDTAVETMLAEQPDLVLVLGPGPETLAYSGADSGSLEPYGVDLRVPLGPRLCAGQCVLPLSLTIGAWLLQRTGWTGDRQGFAVAPDADAAALASELAALEGRVGVLCLGDGTNARSGKAPGYLDERADAVDADIAAALAKGAAPSLDAALAADLGVVGLPAWRVLGALDASWTGDLLYDAAPYGVGYFVATWLTSSP